MRALCLSALATVLVGLPSAAGASDTNARLQRGGTSVLIGDERPTLGSGRFIRQARPAGSFHAIEADDAVDLEIRIGEGSAIEVEADDNLVDRVTVAVEDGVLRVGARGGYTTSAAPLVRVTTPRLERVDLHTSSNAVIRGLRGGRLELASNGSGDFVADGWVEEIALASSGSGGGDLSALDAADARIAVNGSGRVHVRASRSLSAQVNGNGRIVYSGDPRKLRENVAGNGSIAPAGPGPDEEGARE